MDATTTPLRSKSARVAAWFVLFCALALVAAQRLQLGLCSDARHAVLRELVRAPEPAQVVFVGSSQTARGVIPEVFDARAAELGTFVRSVNLSFFGTSRQLAAILASGDRRGMLHGITAPTLVIHGADDPLVRIAGGRDTAANIHGARLKIIPGMGHDFPPALMAGIAVMIAEHCRSDHG